MASVAIGKSKQEAVHFDMAELMILPTRRGVAHGRFSMASLTLIGAIGVIGASACHRQLPPAPTPAKLAPSVTLASDLAAGEGQLVIDVVDGLTQVERIYMKPTPVTDAQGRTRYEFFESPEVLCATTPCVVKLPLGNVVLSFPVSSNPGAREVELVHVEASPTVYRRALSYYQAPQSGRTLGVVATSIGGTTVVAGASMLPIGLAQDIGGLTLAGGISLAAGAILTALGIWKLTGTSSSFRQGSAIHFAF